MTTTAATEAAVNIRRLETAIRARIRTEKAEESGFMGKTHQARLLLQQQAEDALTDTEFEVYEMAVRAGGTIPILGGVLANLGIAS